MLWESERSSCCWRTKTHTPTQVCPSFPSAPPAALTACKCGHMVISSLTFPCEYGSRFIMTLNCWTSQRWVSADVFTEFNSDYQQREHCFKACKHTYCFSSFHVQQQCIPCDLCAASDRTSNTLRNFVLMQMSIACFSNNSSVIHRCLSGVFWQSDSDNSPLAYEGCFINMYDWICAHSKIV